MRTAFVFFVIGFVVFCGWLVVDSGVFTTEPPEGGPCILLQQTGGSAEAQASQAEGQNTRQLQPGRWTRFSVRNAPARQVSIGSTEPASGYKFELQLSSRGASIRQAALSDFDDRNYKNPQPLKLLGSAGLGAGRKLLSMSNREFVFVDQRVQLRLDELDWQSEKIDEQTVRFEAVIEAAGTNRRMVKLTKTYHIEPGSYLVNCRVRLENLSDAEQRVRFNLVGPAGIGREGVRSDMRNVIGGFVTAKGEVVSSRKELISRFPQSIISKKSGLKDSSQKYEEALQAADRARIEQAKAALQIGRNLPESRSSAHFLWAAVSNKYFTAIVRPVPAQGKAYCEWMGERIARFYNPDADKQARSGDETIGIELGVGSDQAPLVLSPQSTAEYGFDLYIGPKDRDLFYANDLYKSLGFVHTITFMPCCCCPASILSPLALGILALMKWMYGFIGNYGVVIIILVLLIRLVLHPVTKKSQVSMNKLSSLGPEAEKIRKKYANNKAEMNKQLMALYKEHGASPVMGSVPMFLQMPIWIALYSAIYASIELRGAAFLPFWITDLSAPDALVHFATVTVPLLGWQVDSVNVLPILMGVAMYLQQKMMPSQAATSANPQAAQQQKIMMMLMPFMFPLLLYKAPSGLNLYIMSSVFAGVIEQYVIRKHIREKQQAESVGVVPATSKTGGRVKKKKPKPFYRNM